MHVGDVIAFPTTQSFAPQRVQLANTFSKSMAAIPFVIDEQLIVKPLQEIALLNDQHVHLEMLCAADVTLMHVYYVHAYFTEAFPHIPFTFSAATSVAVAQQHIVVCCVYDDV